MVQLMALISIELCSCKALLSQKKIELQIFLLFDNPLSIKFTVAICKLVFVFYYFHTEFFSGLSKADSFWGP